MDPTQPPLDITPTITGTSPYSAPNSPYASSSPLASLIAALKGGTGGANAGQQQAGGASPQGGQSAASTTPNFQQFGQQLPGNLMNVVNQLGGSSPTFGGGNVFSGDAFGGTAANPLAGLSAADYG